MDGCMDGCVYIYIYIHIYIYIEREIDIHIYIYIYTDKLTCTRIQLLLYDRHAGVPPGVPRDDVLEQSEASPMKSEPPIPTRAPDKPV